MDNDVVTIIVRVATVTHRSMLVIPHGNQEAAAWLHLNEGVTLREQLLDGSHRISLSRNLAQMRGLGSAIEA